MHLFMISFPRPSSYSSPETARIWKTLDKTVHVFTVTHERAYCKTGRTETWSLGIVKENGKVQKMLAPDLKKTTKWGFLARSNVNNYYFERALALHGICGRRLKKPLFNLCAAMIHLCLKEGKAWKPLVEGTWCLAAYHSGIDPDISLRQGSVI